jgi:hypothetical protein
VVGLGKILACLSGVYVGFRYIWGGPRLILVNLGYVYGRFSPISNDRKDLKSDL